MFYYGKYYCMKCVNCQEETSNPKFCSRSCAATYTNKISPKRIRKRKCTRCDNITHKWNSSLCKEHWEEYKSSLKESYKDRTLGYYKSRECLKGLHQSSIYVHIRGMARSWLKPLLGNKCLNCGYDKHVELCHIKPISSFSDDALLRDINSVENVIPLCPNCHWEFDNGLLKDCARQGTILQPTV